MHISILHYATPPIIGGVESTIYHHARLLFQAGYQISIIGGRGESINDRIPFILIPELDSRHPRVIEIGKQLAAGETSEDFFQLRDEIYSSLFNLFKKTDLVIVHNAVTLHKNFPLTAALKMISERSEPRMVAWCHDFAWQDALYTPDLHDGYPWDLLKTLWPGVEYVAVSDHRRQRLAKLLDIEATKIQVIPPGVDISEFLGISNTGEDFIDQTQLLESEPVILLPARITRRKNIEFAFQITALLKVNYPQVALIVTGPPGPHNPKNVEYLNSLLDLRKSLQIQPNIHFVYQIYGADEVFNAPDYFISELYRLSDLVLFPSLREGFGIPVLEAGLARIPIFASDIPPVRESSAGMINLFDPQDKPIKVADMIETFIENSQSYQFRRHILKNYTWQSIVKNKIIPLLEEKGVESHD